MFVQTNLEVLETENTTYLEIYLVEKILFAQNPSMLVIILSCLNSPWKFQGDPNLLFEAFVGQVALLGTRVWIYGKKYQDFSDQFNICPFCKVLQSDGGDMFPSLFAAYK